MVRETQKRQAGANESQCRDISEEINEEEGGGKERTIRL